MRFAICILCLVCLIGCSSMEKLNDASAPRLLIQFQLPPIPETIQRPTFNLDVVMFIMEDGTVGQTRMLKGSGDAEWDSLAMASIKQWRFAPARIMNRSVHGFICNLPFDMQIHSI